MAGQRHSQKDQEHMDEAAKRLKLAGANMPKDDEQKAFAVPAAKMIAAAKAIPANWNAKDYACSEGWDASTVSGIISQLTSLFSTEMYQQDPEAVNLILASIASLTKYLTGELAGMREGADAAMQAMNLETEGNALKAISATDDELRVGNYIVLFDGRDISPFQVIGSKAPVWKNADGTVGEKFSKSVELDSDYTFTGRLPLDWEHGGAEFGKDELFGYVDWKTVKRDERGVFVERVLNRRKKYVQWVEELIRAGLVGTSSECVDGKSVRTDGGEIVKWPLKRDTLTVAPAEYRMMKEFGDNVITALKALKLVDDTAGQLAPEGASETKTIADDAQAKTEDKNKDGDTMTEEEKKALEAVQTQVTAQAESIKALTTKNAELESKLNAPVLHPNGVGHDPATPADRKGPYKSLGENLMDVYVIETRRGDVEKAHNRTKALAENAKALGMNELLDADGGAMVQTEFSNTLIERTYATGQVLKQVQEQPIGPNANSYSALLIDEQSRVAGSRYGGLQFYRLNEGGTLLPTRPKLRRVEVKAEKIAAACYATDENLQDAVQLEGHINRLFPMEASFVLENELFNGLGGGQTLGILAAPATVSVAKETGQAARTVVYENVLNMWSRCWGSSRLQAAWYINQDIEPSMYKMALNVGTGGAPVFLPPSGISGQPYATLFGRPIIPVEYCATLGTVGDICLADFTQYLGVTKGALKSDSSMHVAFLTDEMVFRFVWRYNARPLWNTALTPASGSGNTLSPYVTLATRA